MLSEGALEESCAIWLESLILKIQYARGHFKEAKKRLDPYLDELDERYDFICSGEKCAPAVEYLFYKMVYFKCKLLRKLRLLPEAEETCNFIMD